MAVPFFKPSITDAEVDEVVHCLRSGWLTSGPNTKKFEAEFAEFVGGKHALAVNSCTAALHLAVEALGLTAGQAVLVPTLTFAATAEILRYQGATPILVDIDPVTLNMDLGDAERKIEQLRSGQLAGQVASDVKLVGIIPVHMAGLMLDMRAVNDFAERHGLWVVEDAAHAVPAAWRPTSDAPWQRCGENTSRITCYSFYANKTLTTGEGGMAVTGDQALADRMRLMCLHGLSHDAWNRFSGGSWDYRIVAPGYKYNMTDMAASVGLHQLRRANELRDIRERLVGQYRQALADVPQIDLPHEPANRIHSWHLFPIRLKLDQLKLDRAEFIVALRERGIGTSVHWRPLHLHPYYIENYHWRADQFPVATREWERFVSLPLYPDMTSAELDEVVTAVKTLCQEQAK
jgi:dTDP-4-amino-4,6-dideoxygalactose transaminase